MSGMETRRGGGVNKGKQPAGTEAGGSQPPGGQQTGGENNPSVTLEALAAQMAESEARAQERMDMLDTVLRQLLDSREQETGEGARQRPPPPGHGDGGGNEPPPPGPAAALGNEAPDGNPEIDDDPERDDDDSSDDEDEIFVPHVSRGHPFPREGTEAVGELADLRQELTYSAFRRRKALQRDSRRQEYRVAYTAASWLVDGLDALDDLLQDRNRTPTRRELLGVYNTFAAGYGLLEDRLALMQLWVEMLEDPRDHSEELLAYVERQAEGLGDGMKVASRRVQRNMTAFHDSLGEKFLKELAGTAAKRGQRSRFFTLNSSRTPDPDGEDGKRKGAEEKKKKEKKEKERARKDAQAARKAAAANADAAKAKAAGGGAPSGSDGGGKTATPPPPAPSTRAGEGSGKKA